MVRVHSSLPEQNESLVAFVFLLFPHLAGGSTRWHAVARHHQGGTLHWKLPKVFRPKVGVGGSLLLEPDRNKSCSRLWLKTCHWQLFARVAPRISTRTKRELSCFRFFLYSKFFLKNLPLQVFVSIFQIQTTVPEIRLKL